MPIGPVALDIVSLQAKEASMETVFRYAHVYPRALALMLMGSEKIDLKPLINRTFEFQEGIDAFNFALKMPADCVKAQIHVGAKA
jgi:D-xylulose reductase